MEGEAAKMNELFKKDITIRILSVFFAVVLWFFVLSDVNPISTIYINVPLKFINEGSLAEKGLGIKNKNYQKDITVAVEGRKSEIKNISENNFEAYVDFSKIKDVGTNELPIDIKKAPEGIKIKYLNYRSIKVDVEKIEEKTFNVDVKIVGNPKSKYIVVNKTASPNTISISGLQSLIESIASVSVQVDVNDLDRDLLVRKDCRVFNANGEEITEFSEKYGVDVTLEVAKEVPVVPVINGNLAEDCVEKSRTVTPEKVLIKGPADILSQIEELYTEPVEIGKADSSIKVKSNIIQPKGTSLYRSPKEAEINITVEKLAVREFTIDRSTINIVSDDAYSQNIYKVEIVTPSVLIKVKGTSSDVEKIQENKLFPTIYLNHIIEGVQKVPLSISVPQGVSLADSYTVEVKITKVEDKNTEPVQNTQDGNPNNGQDASRTPEKAAN